METIDCIKTRRSRRLFLDKKVPEDILRKILDCAVRAPSSVDCQPWHFVIVKDKEKKKKLSKLKDKDNQQHILTAPISIVVCVDTEKSPTRWIEDGVCATENILLAAHNLGLGSVYVTGFKSSKPEIAKKIKKILNLPEKIMPVTILPLGYADPSEKLDKKEILNVDEFIHYL
jgi:nitroreductase